MTKAPDHAERKTIGGRIRRIRKATGLRQWQMAQLIGATQPSVCMYERGVLPDPERLLSIARLGGTTVEWILTGRHSPDGSREMERLPADRFALACLFREVTDEDRARLDSLMNRIRLALASLEEQCAGRLEETGIETIARRLEQLPPGDRRALAAAVALQAAVRRAFFARGMKSLQPGEPEREAPRRDRAFLGSRSMEPVKGPLFRLDPALLDLVEIMQDPEGRAEVEHLLARISRSREPARRTIPRRSFRPSRGSLLRGSI